MTGARPFAFRVAILGLLVGCGKGSPASSPSSTPSNRVAPEPTAQKQSCYPYAKRDGQCLTKCDWSSPHAEQGCAKGEWPLICNRDGTCTPEMRFER